MKRNLIVLALAVFAVLAIWQLKKVIDLRYVSTDAALPVVEVTARTTDTYVDATQPIRDALTQLTNSGGGVLFFGPGKYLVQDTIEIPSNVTIQGVGAGEVGPTMIILGNNGDLNGAGMAVFAIAPGAQNVVIKDLELRSMTPGPNIYPRYDLDRIRDEGTTGLRIAGGGSATRNIKLENLRIVNFTYGIDVGSNDNSDPVIENVFIKSVAMPVNYWALRVRSLNARNWDVQNFNIVELAAGQNGMKLERIGKMSFLEAFCASTLWDGDLCMEIGLRSGPLYLSQVAFEGPDRGFLINQSSSHPIYLENSALTGIVEKVNTIYTFGSGYSLDNENYRLEFTGEGSQSTLYTCGVVFSNGYPNPEENPPAGEPYPGLANVPQGCNFDVTSITQQFASGMLPFEAFDWVIEGNSVASQYLNVKNYGAVGDGVTDDTAAFRAALQESATYMWAASTVLVPSGTYKISDTLLLEDGMTIQSDGSATISFTATDRPLFQVRVMQSDTIIKRGIGIKNINLVSNAANNPGQNATAIDISGNRGASGDFVFSDLTISGFTRGFYVRKDGTDFDMQQPQVDTVGVHGLTFSNNGIAIEFSSQNASNWNIADTVINDMRAGQKGIKLDGGGGIIRNLTCQGASSQNPAEVCMQLGRFGGLLIDNMSSTNTKFAFIADWSVGWMPFPVVIKNSDLRDGFYAAGKMYLLSVNNEYADGGQTSPLGSRSTYFNTYGSDEPCDGRPACNTYPGDTSIVTSCGDVFHAAGGTTTDELKFVGLDTTPVTCQFTPADTTAPTVAVTAPAAGATVSGNNVTVSADASDNIGVVGVQFKLDGSNLGTEDTSAPYAIIWDSTQAANGSYSLTAVARDAAGNSTTSSVVSVTVSNANPDTTMPTVSVTAPTAGATVSGTAVTLSASASDNVGVVGVQFKIDGNDVGAEDLSSPYSISWNSTSVSNGSHVITAVARDAAGNSTVSAGVAVTASNSSPDTTAPTVSITSPTNGATVSGASVTVSANASDNVGLVGVQFKLDGSNLGTEDTSAPYSIIWDSTQASNAGHTLTAVARDAAGNSTTSSAVSVTVSNTVPPSTVAAPVITPNGGTFSTNQTVTLSTATEGATIYYTIDGSTPTTSSIQYVSTFSLSSTTTIRALAVKSGMTNSNVTSATFTRSSTSGGGGSGGGGSSTPKPTPTPTPTPVPTVILPPNVIAGQVIKFPNAPTIYLVQSTGLHPFDTWSSFLAYQARSGAQIITRDGTASTYTVSSILAKTILNQTELPMGMPVEGNDFACAGNPTVYYYYKGKKLAYSEAAAFEAWNGKNYSIIKYFGSEACASIPDGGLVPLPEGTIVRVPGGSEIYMISGSTARPFASYAAYQRDSAGKTTYTVSVSYLHTYSRGAAIN